MADTDIILTGYYHLVGKTVAAVICGLDCGDYVVDAAGSITVPLQSDPDGLLTGDYIASFDAGFDRTVYGDATTELQIFAGANVDVHVPVLVGFPYVSDGQLLRPITEAHLRTKNGPGLGDIRRVYQFAAIFLNAVGVEVGTDFTHLDPVLFANDGEVALTKDTLYSGVWQNTLDDDYGFEGAICWRISRPYPCSITALTGFIETQER